jgi:hypothetical protein
LIERSIDWCHADLELRRVVSEHKRCGHIVQESIVHIVQGLIYERIAGGTATRVERVET